MTDDQLLIQCYDRLDKINTDLDKRQNYCQLRMEPLNPKSLWHNLSVLDRDGSLITRLLSPGRPCGLWAVMNAFAEGFAVGTGKHGVPEGRAYHLAPRRI